MGRKELTQNAKSRARSCGGRLGVMFPKSRKVSKKACGHVTTYAENSLDSIGLCRVLDHVDVDTGILDVGLQYDQKAERLSSTNNYNSETCLIILMFSQFNFLISFTLRPPGQLSTITIGWCKIKTFTSQ